MQDIYGLAAYKLLTRKLPVIGHAIGHYFLWLDRKTARSSDQLVLITEDFRPHFENWQIDPAADSRDAQLVGAWTSCRSARATTIGRANMA